MRKYKKLLLIVNLFALTIIATAQEWEITKDPFGTKYFVENLGQFNYYANNKFKDIKFYDFTDKIFFRKQSSVFMYDDFRLVDEEKDGKEIEKIEGQKYFVQMQWLGSNPNTQIISINKTNHYFTFGDEGYQDIQAKGYEKIIYKNLYQGIDVEYTFDDRVGIKYKIIVLAGADVSQIKMEYTGDFNNITITDKNIVINTLKGNIIDHKPVSFYDNDNNEIKTEFKLENNIVSFEFPDGYDNTKKLIIDPWLITDWHDGTSDVVDIDFDNSGNVYVSGENNAERPYKLTKYNSDGEYQWTFSYPSTIDASSYMEDFFSYSEPTIIRNSGVAYIGTGLVSSPAKPYAIRVNTGGHTDATSPDVDNQSEIWHMVYNNCTEKLYGFGGGHDDVNNMITFPDLGLSGTPTASNFNGYNTHENDVASIVMDDNGDFYSLASTSINAALNDNIQKSLAPGYSGLAFDVDAGYGFSEQGNNFFNNNSGGEYYRSVHSNSIALNKNYLFSFGGKTLNAWNKTSGVGAGSTVVSASYGDGYGRKNTGIDVDNCDNIYVGGINKIHIFSYSGSSFSSNGSISTGGHVFDIKVDRANNLVLSCGDNFIRVDNAIYCANDMIITSTSDCSDNSCSVTSVTGGNPPYTYHWSYNDASTTSITGVPDGTYYVTVTDNSCLYPQIAIDTIVLSCGVLVVDVNSETICKGECADITATITTAGTAPYTYVWNIGTWSDEGPHNACPTSSTTYNVTVTDITGITATASGTITVNQNPTTSISATDISCNGANDGSINLTVTSGASPYQFDWDNDGTGDNNDNEDLTNLPYGTYHITVTDANGCKTTNQASIIQPPPITGTDNAAICQGESYTFGTQTLTTAGTYTETFTAVNGCDSTVTLTLTMNANPTPSIAGNDFCDGHNTTLDAGAGYQSYIWSVGGFTSPTVNILNGGSYSVTVTDVNGCKGTASITITENPNPTPTITGDNFCAGIGSTLDAGAGYSNYAWTGGSSGQTLDITTGGSYDVTVTDANNCVGTANITITEYPNPTPTVLGNDFCENSYTTLSTSSNYNSYYWTGGTTEDTLHVTSAGTYSVTVTDANSCKGTANITITENPNPTPTITGDDFCAGLSSVIDAGTGYSSYSWSSGGNSNSITVTTPGIYTVTVTDANACEGVANITIKENSNPTPVISGNNFCAGIGSTLDAGAGYSNYAWTGGGSGQTLNITAGGSYDVTVTDANNCVGTANINITEYTNPIPAISGNDFCTGIGSILDAGAGYSTYAWTGGGAGQTLNITTGGSYDVTVTDANNCVGTANINITENPNPTPTITGNDFCNGLSSILDAGTGYASYNWTGGGAANSITVTTQGTYSVTVTDANNCVGIASIDITENPNPTPTISGNNFCAGIGSTLDAGAGYSTYAWTGGGSGQTLNITAGGSYDVTVTDANNCVGTANINITEYPNPTPSISGNDFCAGIGSTLDAGAGYSTYAWTGGGSGQTLNITTGGSYDVTVTDANNCVGTANINITENPNPTPTITGNDFCAGLNTTLDAGSGYSTYVWTGGGSGQTLNITAGGSYDVTVTDANNCVGTANINITENPNPIPSISGSLTFCTGSSTTIDAGAGYSTYAWTGGSSGQTLNVNTNGSYEVTVTDANGCTGTDQVTVNVAANLSPHITGVLSICSGSTTTLDAGVGYATYDWSTTETSQTIDVSTTGTYSVTVTDVNGCSGSDQVDVVSNTNPTPSIAGNDFCAGASSTLDAGAGYSTYAWTGGGSGQTLNITAGGSYDVTVTDVNGCVGTANINITENPNPTPSISGNDFCAGFTTTLDVGTGYSTYNWSTLESGQSITISNGGTYSVTVTDANNCQGVDNITINENANPTPTISGDDFCAGFNTTLDAGTGYSTYAWTGGGSGQTLNITAGGSYDVTVTDANNCVGTANINITENPNPTPTITGNDFCAGLNTTLDAGAGYSTYAWTGGGTGQTLNITAGGSYDVTVTDVNGCVGTANINITENPNPTPAIVGHDFCTGFTTTLDAGTGYSTYAWTGGGSGQILTVSSGGTYSVTVTDANNCQGVDNITINENANLNPVILGDDFCAGLNTTLDAGAGYSTYAWTGGGSGQTLNITAGGSYSVTVTDVNGCTGDTSITINVNSNPTPTIVGNNFCAGLSSTLDAGAGYSTYAWTGGGTGQTLNITAGGSYDVTVTDANNCVGTASINITENPNPTPTISGNDFCNGSTDTLTLANTYSSYVWNVGGAISSTLIVNTSGTYAVTVTDANNCIGSDDITINSLALPTPNISGNNFCSGSNSVLDVGTTYPNYEWSTSENTQQITITNGGNYNVTVTDANGCKASASIDITEYPLPTPSITGNNFCSGSNSILDAGSGYASYNWSTSESTQQITITNGGNYTVTVIDANSCQASTSIDITEYPLPTPTISGNDFCNETTETLTLSDTYDNYAWNTGDISSTLTINTSGTYAVTVSDINGCIGSDNITVNTLALPTPNIIGDDYCQYTNTDLDAGTYNSYVWNTSDTIQTINISTPGIYSVTVTDANNCVGTDDITILEIPAPTPIIYGDLFICEGESSVLNAGNGYVSYVWNDATTNQTIDASNTGTYSVTVTDLNGCEGSTSVDLIVNPNPTPDISGLTAICQGDDANLDAGAGYSSYIWSTNDTIQTITIGITGQYAVSVTDTNGCTASDMISVNVNSISISADPMVSTICSGTSIDLTATVIAGVPSFTYNWSNGATTQTQTVSPDTNTTYSVFVTDSMGCVSNTVNIHINVIPGVNLDVSISDDTICPGESVTITSLIQDGVPSYVLYDENGNYASTNFTIYPEIADTFMFYVTDACNSSDTDYVSIHFYPIPSISIQADILQGCPPLIVQFNENNIIGSGYTYEWDFDDIYDINTSTSSTPIHTFNNSGYYDITLNITTPNGCQTGQTIQNMITVFPIPDAKFSVDPDLLTIIDPTFDFINYSEDAAYYMWDFDDGSSSSEFEPSHTYYDVGEYNVELIAVSLQGCKDTARRVVKVKELFTLYVPTAFSPDGDGVNDMFFAKGTGIDTTSFVLAVYDRWGEIIWQATDLYEGWDGYAKGGYQIAQNGTYVWRVFCKDFEGKEHERVGMVTLIR